MLLHRADGKRDEHGGKKRAKQRHHPRRHARCIRIDVHAGSSGVSVVRTYGVRIHTVRFSFELVQSPD